MNPREFKEKPEDLEIHLNRASRSMLLRFLWSRLLLIFSLLFFLAFLVGFWEDFGSILELKIDEKSIKN